MQLSGWIILAFAVLGVTGSTVYFAVVLRRAAARGETRTRTLRSRVALLVIAALGIAVGIALMAAH